MTANGYSWLECEVAPGMFDTERNVRFVVDRDERGDEIDILVDSGLVRARGEVRRGLRVPGSFRVCVVKQEGLHAVVLLPVQSVKYGSYVSVLADRLAPN
jgi:hypothetical protein